MFEGEKVKVIGSLSLRRKKNGGTWCITPNCTCWPRCENCIVTRQGATRTFVVVISLAYLSHRRHQMRLLLLRCCWNICSITASLRRDYIYTTNDRISVRCSGNAHTSSITAVLSAFTRWSLIGVSHQPIIWPAGPGPVNGNTVSNDKQIAF